MTPAVCDDLEPQPGTLGYQLRGTYCEGLYVQPVRSLLRLAALIAPTAQPAEAGQIVVILPTASRVEEYRLRVTARDPSIPYQLDARVSGRRFAWPARDVVQPVLGAKPALDVLAWTGRDQPLFVPVALVDGDLRVSKTGSGPIAAILSTVPIESYAARLIAPGGSVSFMRTVRPHTPVPRIELDLPAHLRSGSYELWVRVRLLGVAAPEQQSWRVRIP